MTNTEYAILYPMLKRFIEWIGWKERLHEGTGKPPYFKEGEMWWAHIGENIGSEVNGKGVAFTRPIVIYKKFGSESFFAIPTSTQIKEGTWYVSFVHKDVREVALLSQGRIMSYKRLKERIGKIDPKHFQDIRKGFLKLYS